MDASIGYNASQYKSTKSSFCHDLLDISNEDIFKVFPTFQGLPKSVYILFISFSMLFTIDPIFSPSHIQIRS